MKFGKRLAAEAARCWPEACLDYKAIKRALKHDLGTGGAHSSCSICFSINKSISIYIGIAAADGPLSC
jgi:hypothetical protein